MTPAEPAAETLRPGNKAWEALQRRLIDQIAEAYGSGLREKEILAARQAFDELRGRVFDDDALYPEHMTLFLEWYVIERPGAEEGVPPLRHALAQGMVAAADEEAARCLCRSHRSVFEVVRESDTMLRLYDLVGDSFWAPRLERPMVGVVRGEIFEARLLPWQGEVFLGPRVFFHPREAHDAIQALAQARGMAKTLDAAFVSNLAEMRLRHSRFRNIAIDHIYRERE